MQHDVPLIYRDPDVARAIAFIAGSFQRLLGRGLVDAGEDVVLSLWAAPCAIVAHGMEADPIFFFGNRMALERFECSAEDFVRMPSRLSAEAMLRDARQTMLERVQRDGFVDDYAGMRVSAKGRRFEIQRGIVWNLIDETGLRHGQAALFE